MYVASSSSEDEQDDKKYKQKAKMKRGKPDDVQGVDGCNGGSDDVEDEDMSDEEEAARIKKYKVANNFRKFKICCNVPNVFFCLKQFEFIIYQKSNCNMIIL